MVTPPLLVLAQLSIELLISRLLMSAGNRRRVIIAGAGELGQELASNPELPYLSVMSVAAETIIAAAFATYLRADPSY